MKQIFKELDIFNNKSKKIVDQLSKLRKSKQVTEQELKKVIKKSESLIITEATTGKAIDKVKLNQLTREKKSLKQEIEQLDHRIKVTEEKKPELLKKHIKDLEKGYKREMNALRKKVEKKLQGITPVVNEYLNYLSDLGRLNKQAGIIHARFLDAAGEVTDRYEKIYRFGYEWLDLNYELFGYDPSLAGARRRGVTKEDQLRAIRSGGLPASILLYNLTGEVEPDQSKARQKYNKAVNVKKGVK